MSLFQPPHGPAGRMFVLTQTVMREPRYVCLCSLAVPTTDRESGMVCLECGYCGQPMTENVRRAEAQAALRALLAGEVGHPSIDCPCESCAAMAAMY